MPQGRRRHLALEIAFACFLQRGLALGLLHAREPLRRLDLLLLLHRPAPLPRMRAWPDCRGTARAHGGGGASPRFGLAGLPRLAAAAPARSPRSARARAERAVRRVFCALCGTRCKATARHETVRSGGQCRGGLLQGAWHRWWAVLARRGAALLSSLSSRRSRPPARAPAARASPHAPDGADVWMRRCVGGDR